MSDSTQNPKDPGVTSAAGLPEDSTPTNPPTTEVSPSRGARLRSGAAASRAWLLAVVGGALLLVSGLLSWSYDDRILGDLSIRFYPAGIQIFAMLLGAVAVVFGYLLKRGVPWVDAASGLKAVGVGSLVFVAAALVAITYQAGGLVNVNEGGWIALVGALSVLAAGLTGLPVMPNARAWPHPSRIVGILIIVGIMTLVLVGVAYALNLEGGMTFVLLLVMVAAILMGFVKSGLAAFVGFVTGSHRQVLMISAFVVAFLFPFTQNGSNANMSIATQILIFAATAVGLNIVVGLAGLLDLGYIAFLGSGAYVAAMMSSSAFATIDWKPPFLVVMLCGGLVAATLGLIIGSPTLRVSGDYLAIVTLAFGEIFRLAMFNLDGNNGPDLTNGPNGIPGIPDLQIGSFNFGDTHTVLGIPLGRFANYYFVLLLLIGFIILVFTRLNNSRIGRGWVAIREDERAAEAMGVNVFGLKLLAFAGGAFLAGLAGTIKAHQDTSVSPDQYIFLESAFLLAAVVLGGMGTVAGVLLGATILKLLPEKLRDVNEYRLMMFGLLLVLMMRFRPEGLVASRRRQLEFHEDDDQLAAEAQAEHLEEVK